MSHSQRTTAISNVASFGSMLQMIGLALMFGGMLALGAFTAPVVFGQLPKSQAAPIMALIFGRFDMVLLVSLTLVLLGEGFQVVFFRGFVKGVWFKIRAVLLALLSLSLLYATLVLNPEIQRLNKAGVHRGYLSAEARYFEGIHKRSEGIYKMDVLLALLLLCMTTWRQVKQAALASSGQSEMGSQP